jgi:hypothetical protein
MDATVAFGRLNAIKGPKRKNEIVRTGRSLHLIGLGGAVKSIPANIYLAR